MSLKYTCNKCGYETNRKWSLQDHYSRISACKKRLKRLSNKTICQNVNENGHFVNADCQNVNVDVNVGCQNVNVTILVAELVP